MHIVRRQRCGQQPDDELPHLIGVERLPRLDRGAACIRRGEPLQAVLPAAEPTAGEIGHELLQAARGFEARMRIGRRVHHDAASGERLDFIADAGE